LIAQLKPSPVETVFAPAEPTAISESAIAASDAPSSLVHEEKTYERGCARMNDLPW
jgi:hypothetical protein